MRKLLLTLLVVLLVVVALVAVAVFVPSPLQKWAVERAATAALAREVRLGEPFHLRLWPPLALTAGDVRVARAEDGQASELARIDLVELDADLPAYWRQDLIKLDHLLLRRPQLRLEVTPDGRRNWDGGAGNVPPSQEPAAPATARRLPGFVLGDIRIEDGTLGYDDRSTGRRWQLEQIGLTIAQAGADQAVRIDGSLTMAGKPATLQGSVVRAAAAVAGESSPATIDLHVPGGAVAFDGTLSTAGPALHGATEIDLSNPRELLAWLGQPATLPENALRTAGLRGQIAVSAERAALDQAELHVDDLRGSGHVAATLAELPRIDGELAFSQLDLDPYLPPEATPGPAGAGQAPEPSPGWSDAPIEPPLPLPADLDVRVAAAGLKARNWQAGPLALRLQADRQQASIAVERLEAYGGALSGRAEARPGERPAYALALQGQGLRVAPLLQALGSAPRLDGAMELQLALTAIGASERQLVGASNGKGRIVVRDGAILGVDLTAMLRQIMTLGLGPQAAEQPRTDFAEAGGSFTITNGIVRNEDLALRAPLLRLDGAGTIDLPQRTLDYRIRPRLALSLPGRDPNAKPALDAGLPFMVQGPLASPAIRFDLNGTLTSAISSPADLAKLAGELARNPEAVRLLRDQFKLLEHLPGGASARTLLDNLLGGGQPQGQDKQAPSLEDAARGLLKRLDR